MFELDKITLYKSILHTIYKNNDFPIVSQEEIDNDDEISYNLFISYIEKILKSNKLKWSDFKEEKDFEYILEALSDDPSIFVEATQDFVGLIHEKIKKYIQYIPSFDLVCTFFEMNNLFYFAALKINHKNMYTRLYDIDNSKNINKILLKNDLYLSPKSSFDEGFIVELKTMRIALIDKMYVIEGEKQGFFADLVLNLNTRMSEKEKLDSFNKININLQDKFIGDDLEQRANIKKAISDTLVETGRLDVDVAIEKAFEDGQEIKKIYKEAMNTAKLLNEKIEVDDSVIRKKIDVQKIITNTGIELSIPVRYYEDSDKVEIITNEDGSLTFIIKNVSEFRSS